MKITVCFEANSMAQLKDQLLEAFGSISAGGGELVSHSGLDHAKPGYGKSLVQEIRQSFENVEKSFEEKEAERSPVAVFGEHPQRIDGHVVSDGNVWVQSAERSNAFSPVPVETYMENKKEEVAEEPKKKRTRTKKGTEPAGVVQAAAPVVPDFPVASEPANVGFIKAAPQEVPVTESNAPAIGSAPDMYSYDGFKTNLALVLVKLYNQKKLYTNDLQELCKYFQVTELWMVSKNDEQCKMLYDHFVKHGLITGV